MPMTDYDPDDRWQDEWMEAVYRIAETFKEKHQSNPWPHIPVLPEAMKYLMTELWDRGFSQTEIREAFETAILDMPTYTADQERRS